MEQKMFETLLKNLFQQQMLGVLATHATAVPYVSLVAFAETEDLKRLVFITSRSTRKFTNITANSNVSMLVDNRSNQAADFSQALAVSIIGHAVEVQGRQIAELFPLFLGKHPDLKSFTLDSSFALMTVLVDRYIIVRGFADVTEVVM
jgi:heme iron utilization protein